MKEEAIIGNESHQEIDEKEARELVKVFYWTHGIIDDPDKHSIDSEYRITMPNSIRDTDTHDNLFLKFKSILVSFLKSKYSIEELGNRNSFVKLTPKEFWRGNRTNVNLKDYLEEIITVSNSCFDYLFNIVKFANSKNSEASYKPYDLKCFCSEYFYIDFKRANLVINIKKIKPVKKQYLYRGEKERFDKIENLWLNCDYRNVIIKCRELLTYFLEYCRKKFEGKGFTNKKKKKKEVEAVIRKMLSSPALKIKGLYKDMDEVFNRFRNLRNKFKDEAKDNEEEKLIVDDFENSSYINKRIHTRLLIDQLKTFHNVLMIFPNVVEIIEREEK